MVDSDRHGRADGKRIAADLDPVAANVTIVDLATSRNDGHDLTDWLVDGERTEIPWR